jgi:hypothetical protein
MTVPLGAADPVRPSPALQVPKVLAHRITLLRDWVAAVERHVPGELDAAAMSLVSWSRDDVETAWLDVQALIAIVARPTATRFTARPSGQTVDVADSPGLATLREMAAAIRTRAGGPDPFYKRAAVLHADIAMSDDRGAASAQMSSMFVETRDGARVGIHHNVVHWEFGRLLLGSVRQPSDDEFVRDWFRATMAFKMSVGELDTSHFEHGGEMFPRDPTVQFLLGCLHERFADPRVQSAAGSVNLPPGIRLKVQAEGAELRAAERYFRGAIEVDPDHVEARVRHGRVLGRLERHQQAAEELRGAVARVREPLVSYYAHLFLGAEEEALGRLQQARAAYSQAAALYPRAQAPRVGLSQLLHRSGDRVAARAALAPALSPPVSDPNDDPWWTYRIAPGRHTDDLIAIVYRTLDTGGTQ